MSPFFQLVQISLGIRDGFDSAVDSDQWARMFKTATRQTLIGVTFKGIERLPLEQQPPVKIKLKWALLAEKIAEANRKIDKHCAEITGIFREMGIRSCILKGQGAALLYPWPEARQSGDIDLWVDLPCRKALPAIKGRWQVGDVCYHHADVKAFTDGTELEVHFRPSWMNSPYGNFKLQRYFSSKSSEQFANESGKGFNQPTCAFNCVFSLVHIYRHLLHEGIGMRQLLDYYFILKASTGQERTAAYRFVAGLKMKKFCGAVMYVLQTFFGLEDEYLLCPADSKYGSFLVDEVMKAGNFGHYDSRNKYRKTQSLPTRIFHRMKHLLRFPGIAGSEVLWAPFFKSVQYIWRKINNY